MTSSTKRGFGESRIVPSDAGFGPRRASDPGVLPRARSGTVATGRRPAPAPSPPGPQWRGSGRRKFRRGCRFRRGVSWAGSRKPRLSRARAAPTGPAAGSRREGSPAAGPAGKTGGRVDTGPWRTGSKRDNYPSGDSVPRLLP